jgi:hypothetical protein
MNKRKAYSFVNDLMCIGQADRGPKLYGKLTISWDNSILPSYCALKANKYVFVCWPR